MRYFNTARAHGCITRATDELNIAASAVSAAIDQIEAQFQPKHVNRFRSRGIVVTASGKMMERKFARREVLWRGTSTSFSLYPMARCHSWIATF